MCQKTKVFVLAKTSGFPAAADSAAAAAGGRPLRSQPDPSPNAPRDEIRRKGPCCDQACLWGAYSSERILVSAIREGDSPITLDRFPQGCHMEIWESGNPEIWDVAPLWLRSKSMVFERIVHLFWLNAPQTNNKVFLLPLAAP